MEKTLSINGRFLSYTEKISTRARSVRLIVHSDSTLTIAIPKKIGTFSVEKFIESKSVWIFEKMDYFKKNQKTPVQKHTAKEIAEYKKQAMILVTARLEYFNQFYGFSWKNISIKNTKSRWGSCSKQGNLNFNYKIALLVPELADYIVVHELSHLGELNHSTNFWSLVARTVPNHKELRKQLKVIS